MRTHTALLKRQRFARWLQEARLVHSIDSARRKAEGGSSGSGDLKLVYADKAELVRLCKSLGLMEDLKAGVPRTAYHGVVMVRMGGRRVFLTPSFHVDQDITLKSP